MLSLTLPKEGRMGKWRNAWVRSHVEDCIVEALEESFNRNLITLEEKTTAYTRLGNHSGYYGLLCTFIPRLPAELKAAIQQRVNRLPKYEDRHMHEGLIVEKGAKASIPPDVIQGVCNNFNGQISVSYADQGKINTEVFENAKADANATITALSETLEILGDHRVVLFGQRYKDGDVMDEDKQPFPIIIGDDNHMKLVAFLEGTFPGYDREDSHSPEYYAFSEYIFEKINEAYEACGKDLTKLMGRLDTAVVRKDFGNLWTPRGFLTLFDCAGRMIHYPKNELALNLPWGNMSRPVDEIKTEVKVVEVQGPPAKAETPAERIARIRAAAAGKAPVVASTSPIAPQPTSVPIVEKPKTDTAVPSTAGKDERIFPPAKLTKNRQIKNWVNNNFQNSASHNADDVRKNGIPRSLLKASSAYAKAPAGTVQALVEKDADKYPDEPEVVSAPAETMPILLPQARKDITEYLKNVALVDPEKIKGAEEPYQSFFQQTGYKLEDFIRLPRRSIQWLCEQHKFATSIVIRDLLNMLVELKPELVGMSKPKAETKTEEPVAAPAQPAESPADRIRRLREAAKGKAA